MGNLVPFRFTKVVHLCVYETGSIKFLFPEYVKFTN
jgi:hypothetical protein